MSRAMINRTPTIVQMSPEPRIAMHLRSGEDRDEHPDPIDREHGNAGARQGVFAASAQVTPSTGARGWRLHGSVLG